ncbi:hypothetical protein EDD17DRAFT_1655497 [Pisolithus thermaeus]|nr:hypothetical protein EDD17DRAFT_1655497 [Pisolithus thermaeus]
MARALGNDADVMEELEERPDRCLDLSFMHTLLVLRYDFGENGEVELGNTNLVNLLATGVSALPRLKDTNIRECISHPGVCVRACLRHLELIRLTKSSRLRARLP